MSAINVRTVVFASSRFALPAIDLMLSQGLLAGVVLPDPNEETRSAVEINALVYMLSQNGVAFQMCCQEKLPLLVKQLDAWQASCGVILTYPHILPIEVLRYFSLGAYNVHGSALPDYPGPAPLYWQIRNCEKNGTLVIHKAEEAVDSGDLVITRELDIHALDTLQSYGNRLAYEARLAVESLVEILRETGRPAIGKKQDDPSGRRQLGARFARRPSLEDGHIIFAQMMAEEISARCRAGVGQPYAARFLLKNVPITVIQSTPVCMPTYGTAPATVLQVSDPEGLIICVKDGALRLDVIASDDGIFGGLAFAQRFYIDAGNVLDAI